MTDTEEDGPRIHHASGDRRARSQITGYRISFSATREVVQTVGAQPRADQPQGTAVADLSQLLGGGSAGAAEEIRFAVTRPSFAVQQIDPVAGRAWRVTRCDALPNDRIGDDATNLTSSALGNVIADTWHVRHRILMLADSVPTAAELVRKGRGCARGPCAAAALSVGASGTVS